MAALAPPVQVVTAGAPPFVHVPSGAPPFVAVTHGLAPPITIVASGAPPITLFNEDGSLWTGGAGATPVGGAALLTGETDGFATDFTYATDANRVAKKVAGVVTEYALDSFYSNAGTSPKQVYDVSGNLVWTAHNMCLQSQTFEQTTPWNLLSNLTVVTNAIAAPDGTTTADRIVEVANTSNHAVLSGNITTLTGESYTYSVYAKAGERNWLAIAPVNQAPADWFDLTAGTVGTTANGGVMTDAGNGWWRCSITQVSPAATRGPYFWLRTSNGQISTYLGDITKGLYLWGAQVNRGAVPLPYLPTTTAARNGLAVDYDPVTHAALGLKCEPAATNLILNNAAMSTQNVTVTAVAHTLSFFGTGTLTLSGVSTAGPLVGTGASDRVSLTFTPTAGTLTLTVTGTVSRAQLEIGTVATSPINTFAATVTRAANGYSVTAASINHSATAGSWWADVQMLVAINGTRIIDFGTPSPLYQGSATVFSLFDGTVLSKTVTSTVGLHKVASAFQASDRALVVDGLAAAADAGATAGLLAPVTINFGSATNINGYIRKLTYRPRRVTNADMATETA